MDNLIIYSAKYLVLLPVILAIYVLWRVGRPNRRQLIYFMIAVGILSFLLAQVAQHLYVNPRPPFKDGSMPLVRPSDYNGFPSDHTLFAAAIAFGLLRCSPKWGGISLVLALLVGWARVAAHVHYLTDIFGAIVIAALAYAIVELVAKKLKRPKIDHGRTGK